MKQQAQKKAWKTPELIILVRSKPQEAVLTACKGETIQIGEASSYAGCAKPGNLGGTCWYWCAGLPDS